MSYVNVFKVDICLDLGQCLNQRCHFKTYFQEISPSSFRNISSQHSLEKWNLVAACSCPHHVLSHFGELKRQKNSGHFGECWGWVFCPCNSLLTDDQIPSGEKAYSDSHPGYLDYYKWWHIDKILSWLFLFFFFLLRICIRNKWSDIREEQPDAHVVPLSRDTSSRNLEQNFLQATDVWRCSFGPGSSLIIVQSW